MSKILNVPFQVCSGHLGVSLAGKCLLARDPLTESPRLHAHLFLSKMYVMVMQTAFQILPLLSPEGI